MSIRLSNQSNYCPFQIAFNQIDLPKFRFGHNNPRDLLFQYKNTADASLIIYTVHKLDSTSQVIFVSKIVVPKLLDYLR